MILDHTEELELPEDLTKKFRNELQRLKELQQGLHLLYRYTGLMERRAQQQAADGAWAASMPAEVRKDFQGKDIRVLSLGNDPVLNWLPKRLVYCFFQWYSVSVCNYVRLVGWILKQVDPERRKPVKYVGSVIPDVLRFRNKIAAHFAIAQKPKHDGDTDADRAESTMYQLSFDDGRFYVPSLKVTLRRSGGLIKSGSGQRWSLTAIHEQLAQRYWPKEAITSTNGAQKQAEKKEERRFSQEQYDMLKRCSDKKDMSEWNEWRKRNPLEVVLLEGANLAHCHLEGANLEGGRLSNAHLEQANFKRACLANGSLDLAYAKEANFESADLKWAFLTQAHMEAANFSGALLENAILRDADLQGANLGNANMRKADFTCCDLKKANLIKSHLEGAILRSVRAERAHFSWAHLQNAVFNGAELKGAYFWGADLKCASLYLADLEGADLYRSCAQKVNFTFANLTEADLRKANLKEACLVNARLTRARMNGAFMESIDLWCADLEGAELSVCYVKGGKLRDTNLTDVCLENAYLRYANLDGAHLEDANLEGADIVGASLQYATVNGSTLVKQSKADRFTNFCGVGLDTCRIDPGTKQLLAHNIRRLRWENWYKGHRGLRWLVKPFWLMSDYGRSTGRIIGTFFGLAFVFAFVYWLCPKCVMVNGVVGDIRGFVHALYFSVVTMTTLGFGDIAANPDSWGGQVLLMAQVILGYVLLGALVTRFAVLFTAGGPAGKFARERGWFVQVKYWLKLFVKLGLSVLGAGLSYIGWLAYSIPVLKGEAQLWLKAACWLSAPLLTGLGFAVPIVIFERLAGTAKEGLFRTLLWPVAACAVGAAVVFPFGPMLIVFSMFMAGTGAVVLREVLLHRKNR